VKYVQKTANIDVKINFRFIATCKAHRSWHV